MDIQTLTKFGLFLAEMSLTQRTSQLPTQETQVPSLGTAQKYIKQLCSKDKEIQIRVVTCITRLSKVQGATVASRTNIVALTLSTTYIQNS